MEPFFKPRTLQLNPQQLKYFTGSNTDENHVTMTDCSKRKREDYGLEDIRIRVENLLAKSRTKDRVINNEDKLEESKSFGGCATDYESVVTPQQKPAATKSPSRIPRKSLSFQESSSGSRTRGVTPRRVQNYINYFEELTRNTDVYKAVLSQERQLGIERTSIPISVKIKSPSFDSGLNFVQSNVVSSKENKSVFVFAAPTPVNGIPRLIGGKNVQGRFSLPTNGSKIPMRQSDTPSKIPVLDKSKFFAGDSRMSFNRNAG